MRLAPTQPAADNLLRALVMSVLLLLSEPEREKCACETAQSHQIVESLQKIPQILAKACSPGPAGSIPSPDATRSKYVLRWTELRERVWGRGAGLTTELWAPTLMNPLLNQSACRALRRLHCVASKQSLAQVQCQGTHCCPVRSATPLNNPCYCHNALQRLTECCFNVISRWPAIFL